MILGLGGDGGDGLLGDLVLHLENVGEFAVVALGPDRAIRARVDQLDCHADAGADLTDGPFEDVLDPKPRGDLAGRCGLAPEGEA